VFSERASPFPSWARSASMHLRWRSRTCPDHRRAALARPLRPPGPRRHRAAGAARGALRGAPGRGRSPDRLGVPAARCASSTGGRRPRCRDCAGGHAGPAFLGPRPARRQPHAVGLVGADARRAAPVLQRRHGLLPGFKAIGERFGPST
jgi:hypothetical protein